MASILNKFKTPYLKDILTSLSGTTLSQVIAIGMAPILTRIYSPSDYGLLGIYMSITAILFVFVSLQYSQAILQTATKEEEDNIVGLCHFITFIYSTLIAIIIALLYYFKVPLFIDSKLGNWLFALPISIFLFGVNTTLTKILNKYKAYRGLSISQIVTSIATVSFSLLFGLLFKNYIGLFIGFLSGQLIRFIILLVYARKNKLNINNISTQKIKVGIIKFKKFPLFSIPTEFLYGWTDQLPVYFFNAYFNTTVIGHFNYGKRMVSLPISFITGAVGNVFAQKATEQYNNTGNCKKVFINTFKMLAFPLLPFFVILGVFAPTIFDFVFGNEWLIAGTYVQILIPMFYLKAVVSPLSYMYIIKNKQDEDMVLHVISFVLVAISFYTGYLLKSDIKTILYLFTFSYCFIYIYTLYRSYLFSK